MKQYLTKKHPNKRKEIEIFMSNFKKELSVKSGGRQSGTSLYLAIIVMVILLAIVLGLTTILVGQMRMVKEMGYSVIALSAADAGIEEILVNRDFPSTSSVTLANGASYETSLLLGVLKGGPQEHCSSTIIDWNYCITSVGKYEGVRRGIEIAY